MHVPKPYPLTQKFWQAFGGGFGEAFGKEFWHQDIQAHRYTARKRFSTSTSALEVNQRRSYCSDSALAC